jgi:FtsZ-binding cell division protein ZapB
MSDVTTVDVVDADAPAISHDEYLELVTMRQSILELKAQKADILEWVNQYNQMASQAQQAGERLQALNEALQDNSTALQERMKEIIEPHGVAGEFVAYVTPSERSPCRSPRAGSTTAISCAPRTPRSVTPVSLHSTATAKHATTPSARASAGVGAEARPRAA